jgi:DNA helicase-2/ATP-dependent DNA helicase PcrA
MKTSSIIYGPPGTGKSSEIMRRVTLARESGVAEERIGLVSYTKAAAHELARRAGVKPGSNISTLHSYAFRLLGLIREQVVDYSKLKEFSRVSGIETTGSSTFSDQPLGPGDHCLAVYDHWRATLGLSLEQSFKMVGYQTDFSLMHYFREAYERWKHQYGYVDYADMLALALGAEPPDLDILFLDEAQDFSPAQWRLINHWLPHINELVFALDDDQTLYEFNGATPLGALEFERQFNSTRQVLNQSWRLPSNIKQLAEQVIGMVHNRVPKDYQPVRTGGQLFYYAGIEAVYDLNDREDTLILYRNHSLRKDIEKHLQNRGLPYYIDNGRPGPLQNSIAQAIRAWQNARDRCSQGRGQEPLDPIHLRALKKAVRYGYRYELERGDYQIIGTKPWDQVFDLSRESSAYYQRLQQRYGSELPPTKIHLSTIHGAKGREADRVILIDGMSTLTADNYFRWVDPEVRCFYVGVTRSKQRLDIVCGPNRTGLL